MSAILNNKILKKYMKYIPQIILLQKYIRGHILRKQFLIPSSYYQTKDWRTNRPWYITGKSNECEKYQINLIEDMLKNKWNKTYDRINMDTIEIMEKQNPMIYDNGYEWSENFDGKLEVNNMVYYFNLKFVCGQGGSQTRTLREVYHFIEHQMEYLLKYNNKNTYFINILDGDTCYNNIHKFHYLLNKEKYKHIKNYMYIGDLNNFQNNKINYKL
jgi:hypothetical protein